MDVRLLVTGGNGQLAQEVKAEGSKFPCHVILATRADLDICSAKTKKVLRKLAPTHIINAAAYTAVDKAEDEAYEAMQANAMGVRNLAEASHQLGISLLHVSTDFVFDGTKKTPYSEKEIPNPLGVYGRTKLYGEDYLLRYNPDALIVRTSWLYSSRGNNFVKTMLQLAQSKKEIKVVADQIGTPTYARDLARCLLELVYVDRQGVNLLHYSNEGVTSWHGFAEAIMEITGASTKVLPIPTSSYPTPAKRPGYSVLDKTQISKLLSKPIPHWKDSLRECLAKIKI